MTKKFHVGQRGKAKGRIVPCRAKNCDFGEHFDSVEAGEKYQADQAKKEHGELESTVRSSRGSVKRKTMEEKQHHERVLAALQNMDLNLYSVTRRNDRDLEDLKDHYRDLMSSRHREGRDITSRSEELEEALQSVDISRLETAMKREGNILAHSENDGALRATAESRIESLRRRQMEIHEELVESSKVLERLNRETERRVELKKNVDIYKEASPEERKRIRQEAEDKLLEVDEKIRSIDDSSIRMLKARNSDDEKIIREAINERRAAVTGPRRRPPLREGMPYRKLYQEINAEIDLSYRESDKLKEDRDRAGFLVKGYLEADRDLR